MISSHSALFSGVGTPTSFTPLDNRSVHEIDFRLPLGEHILQHARAMLAGSVRALLHQLSRIAVQFDSQLLRNRLAFRDQVVEKMPGRLKARRRAVMQQRERTYGIRGRIEDQLGPLRAASVFQGYCVHSRTRHQPGQFFHFLHRGVGLLERSDPGVAFDVITDMSRRDRMSGGKRRASNHELHTLRDNFFVADTVLNRTHRALIVEDVRDLRDCDPGMNRFCRDNAVVAARQLFGIAGRVEPGSKVFRP